MNHSFYQFSTICNYKCHWKSVLSLLFHCRNKRKRKINNYFGKFLLLLNLLIWLLLFFYSLLKMKKERLFQQEFGLQMCVYYFIFNLNLSNSTWKLKKRREQNMKKWNSSNKESIIKSMLKATQDSDISDKKPRTCQ